MLLIVPLILSVVLLNPLPIWYQACSLHKSKVTQWKPPPSVLLWRNSNGITVALDITISEELRKEGIARELVNRIQNIRKDSGFEVTDKIKVQILKNDSIEQAVLANESYIKSETLTNELIFVSEIKNGTEIEFDELKTIILISK